MQKTLLNNRYRIVQDLDEGGFGKTFIAEDTHMPSKRRCVIKVLHSASNNPPELQKIISERFEREAAVLEALGESIDQIPKLYAYFKEGGEYYLVQELIEGQTLGEKTLKVGPMSEAACREFLTSFLDLLARVHSQGIIHRDIKPSNIIMRARDGRPVLIDFGIVKEAVSLSVDKTGNTRTVSFGTPGYASYEQARGTPVFASDLYSLGVTTIYVLTGKSPNELIDLTSGDIHWRGHVSNMSPEFAAILDKSIEPNYRDRYRTALEMLEAINSLAPIESPKQIPHRDQAAGKSDKVKADSSTVPIAQAVQAEAARRVKARQLIIEGNEAFNAKQFELAQAKWKEVLRLSPDETGVVENIKAAQKAIQEEADLKERKMRLISEAEKASDSLAYDLAIRKWEEVLRLAPDEPDVKKNIQAVRQKQLEVQKRKEETIKPYQEQPLVGKPQVARPHEPPTVPYGQRSQGQQERAFAEVAPTTNLISDKPVKRRVGWFLIGIAIIGIGVLLIVFTFNMIPGSTPDNEKPSETAGATDGRSNPPVTASPAVEAISYYLEIKDGNKRITEFEPLDFSKSFRFHFATRKPGYLYLIGPGANDTPTVFLTTKPIPETGMETNKIEAGANFQFPKTWIRLDTRANSATYTVVFSREPLLSPAFLASSMQELTAADLQQVETMSARIEAEPAGDRSMVKVPASMKDNESKPLVFDIRIKRK